MFRPCFLTLLTLSAPLAAAPLSYNREVRPVLSDNCFACHGPDKNNRKADLRLDQPGEKGCRRRSHTRSFRQRRRTF
jgi:hypothetical protein